MKSLRARVALVAALVLAVFVAATGLALDRAFRDSARSARAERLLGQLYLLMAAADVDPAGHLVMPERLAEPRFSLPGSGLYGEVSGGRGETLWRSPSAVGVAAPFRSSLAPGRKRFEERADAAGRAYFVYSFGVQWATGPRPIALTFSVAEDLSEFNLQISHYRASLYGWLGVMALLLLGALAGALTWGLAPLRRVSEELKAIESGQKDRVEGRYPQELAALTENLNALLSRERAQQKRYRDGLADLAHSLKTPLAVLRGALSEKPVDPELTQTFEEQIARLDRAVEYHLQRAAAGGATGLAAPVPVAASAQKLLASLAKVYREKAPIFEIAVEPGVAFRGTEGDLVELLGNLLDNACKWCRRQVRVSARRQGRALVISVEDDGPGIEPAFAREILERGVRADESVPGHGIGLAVVRDIVAAYRGEVQIGVSSLGGAAVSLRLPQS